MDRCRARASGGNVVDDDVSRPAVGADLTTDLRTRAVHPHDRRGGEQPVAAAVNVKVVYGQSQRNHRRIPSARQPADLDQGLIDVRSGRAVRWLRFSVRADT